MIWGRKEKINCIYELSWWIQLPVYIWFRIKKIFVHQLIFMWFWYSMLTLIHTYLLTYHVLTCISFVLGQALPMPPELMELYNLYKQELETRSTKENQFVEELDNQIIRVGTRPGWSNLASIFVLKNSSLLWKLMFLSKNSLIH